MKLIDVEVNSFRRLKEAKVNLDGKLIALLGPNEAGKTSLLQLLRIVDEPDDLALVDFSNRTRPTRGTRIARVRYLLDAADLAAVVGVPGASDLVWFTYSLLEDGTTLAEVEPRLHRDIRARARGRELVSRALDSKWAKARLVKDSDDELVGALHRAAEILTSKDEDLDRSAINDLSVVADLLEDAVGDTPKSAQGLGVALRRIAQMEKDPHPEVSAARILGDRRPQFLWFGERERTLAPEYDLSKVAAEPPPALSLLASLAGLDLLRLYRRIGASDWGAAEALIDAANNALKEYFSSAWRQSSIAVRFRSDEAILRILVSRDEGGYSSIAERSDGLRSFVALVAFTSSHDVRVPPILLVDEAEMHLHYDAQADLVQVLTRQEAATQVIYSTHSAGCLPEDFGTGVRIIEKIAGSNFSRIRNAFWDAGSGFTPLLIGMGASALAVAPTRRALIAEGPSELIMLPTLLREVLKCERLDLQIAPGLSRVNIESVSDLELQAPRVAYVVDGDQGGAQIAKKLRAAAVDESRIIYLGGKNSGLVIEDVLRAEVYSEAVNEELRRSNGASAPKFTCESGSNRPQQVRQFCEAHGISSPHKTAVAQRVVEQRSYRRLVAPQRQTVLRQLFRQAQRLLA